MKKVLNAHLIDGKWDIKIDGKYAFEMYARRGIPIEYLEETINALPLAKKCALVRVVL